jgi:catechol 2,3-dioxygenase-like lactoylglutathione lyase family enzyme
MELTLHYTFLEVDDHEAALAFYRDTLGRRTRARRRPATPVSEHARRG